MSLYIFSSSISSLATSIKYLQHSFLSYCVNYSDYLHITILNISCVTHKLYVLKHLPGHVQKPVTDVCHKYAFSRWPSFLHFASNLIGLINILTLIFVWTKLNLISPSWSIAIEMLCVCVPVIHSHFLTSMQSSNSIDTWFGSSRLLSFLAPINYVYVVQTRRKWVPAQDRQKSPYFLWLCQLVHATCSSLYKINNLLTIWFAGIM